MKRTFTILTAALALLAFLAIPMGMRGQTSVTWPGTTALPGTATAVANNQNVTIMASSTNDYSNPIRIYANTTVTIKALNNAKILSVAYEASSTGNYVTNAQNATVSPNVTPTVSDKIVTWTYAESANVTEFTFKPSAQTRSNGITITYMIPGATPTCATPTFSPAAGTYTQAQTVSISCTTEGATIYYTTNGTNPTLNSSVYSGAINVSSNTTIKAMAVAQGYENSAIATAEYAFITLDHAGTLEDPYTVADARNAIDANTGTQGVYATGIVSAIPSAWSTDYSNITFNFVDNVGDNNFLQAYRCVSGTGVDASQVAVGDVVVVYGNLIKYGSTYEFGQGCQLVSLTHPSVPSITIAPALVELNATGEEGAQMVTLSITCENIQVETEFAFGIQFYDAEGIEQDNPTWMVSGVNGTNDEGYFVNLTILDNYDEARSAYLKVHVSDNNGEEVYSNLVTVNQEAPELPHVTWDLSIASYDEITDSDIVTWSSEYATMTNSSKSGGTSASNYLGGDSNNRTSSRFYSGNTLTISPVAGYAITSVVFTATSTNYANALVSSTWTNATASADGTAVTVTPTDGPTAMVATIGGTCGFTSVTVYYEENNVPAVPSVTVTPNVVNATADETEGTLTITYENIPELISFDYYFCDPNGGELEGDDPDWIYAEINEPGEEENYTITYIIDANQGEARTACFKVYTYVESGDDSEEVYAIVTVNQAEFVSSSSITITPDNFELDANSHMAEVLAPITYQNIVVVSGSGTESFNVQYYDAEGQEIEQTWCTVGAAAEGDTDFNLIIAAGVNEGNEARTAYFKLYGLDEEANLVYSNLVTVTQAAPVIDYAVLPFVWEGGSSADFAALNGTTLSGNGSDYASGNAPYLIKLDNNSDYIQVKCDQQPGKVTIGVKMIGGGNTSTITIQGSADGETFTDIEELTISGAQNDTLTLETTNAFADADRYVRMLFTKGSNVGVGPITIEKGSAPSIAVTPATLDLEATGTGQNGMQMQQFVVTYHNLDIESHDDFAVQFYDAEGEEQEQPTWITPNPAYVMGGNEEGYMVILFIEGNIDVARSAYFKVYALGEEDDVYSNLVTINQAGAPQQYTLTVEPFENLDLITFVNDEMVMEGDGEIQVNEGDEIMLSVVAMEGYVMETLMLNGVNHVNDIADDYTYSFEMPAENVTISATAVEDVPVTSDEYVLYTGELVEGDYLIVYDGSAMNTTVTNDRLQYEDVTVTNDVIVTDNAEIVWHIAPSGQYWTIYNADAEAYAASTGVKNKAQMLADGTDDKALWTVSGTETYEFVNKQNTTNNVNANLRKNGTYGFACYATGTGGALSLYKKVAAATETYTLTIEGYEDDDNEGGYYLIASPVNVNLTNHEMTTGDFDLYYFDQAQDEEWRNYEVNAFNLEPGKGYLYAHKTGGEFTLTGTPYTGNGTINLVYDNNATDFKGWNLVGNPWTVKAYPNHAFYAMNNDGSGIDVTVNDANTEVAPKTGIFVVAENANETVTFATENPGNKNANLAMNLTNSNKLIDRAIVRFGEGRQLPKFQLNPNHTKVYFQQEGKDYAIVNATEMGEMPVSFKAENNGIYTLSVNAEEVSFAYLHLIDNMNGNDVDLLANPSYSFEAKSTDYESRFKLVFATGNASDDSFAFFSNGSFVINNEGNATLQVIDVNGRILKSESINGCANLNVNAASGVYMIRLVNGDNVKVQKVVVR